MISDSSAAVKLTVRYKNIKYHISLGRNVCLMEACTRILTLNRDRAFKHFTIKHSAVKTSEKRSSSVTCVM